jgi:hypothetical protein
MQLCMGHIGLNHHLFHIHKVKSPVCPHCQGLTVETVKHVLLDCPFYLREQHILRLKLQRNVSSIHFLLSSPIAVKHLLTFIHSTGCFKEYVQLEDRPMTNVHCNAELIAKARAIGLLLLPDTSSIPHPVVSGSTTSPLPPYPPFLVDSP